MHATKPFWMLHRADFNSGQGQFVESTTDVLHQQSFLDGRSTFWTQEEIRPLAIGPVKGEPTVSRFIFHIAFCGSTLLSKILDIPGKTVGLREPQGLTDYASLVARNHSGETIHTDGLRLLLGQIAPSAISGPIILKPSNWSNNLLPDICALPGTRAVFMTMDDMAFMQAVFRGGRERLVYVANAASHLANATGIGQAALASATKQNTDALDQIAHLAAGLLFIQKQLFSMAMNAHGWGDSEVVTLEQLTRDTVGAAASAAAALDLDLSSDEIACRVKEFTGLHSKGGQPFSSSDQGRMNQTVWKHHGSRIERALEWSHSVLG